MCVLIFSTNCVCEISDSAKNPVTYDQNVTGLHLKYPYSENVTTQQLNKSTDLRMEAGKTL
jgi:hypothetical protein